MRRSILMLALVVSCKPSADATSDSARPAAVTAGAAQGATRDTAAVRQALLQLEQQWTAAHVSRDPAALDRILAEEYVGVTATGDYWPKAEEIAMTRAGTASDPAAASAAQAPDSVHVRLYGDVALMTSRIAEPGKGSAGPRHYYYTSAYVWRDGRWQAVMGHVSGAAAKP
jgi:ketosteroid isomerase-like protein